MQPIYPNLFTAIENSLRELRSLGEKYRTKDWQGIHDFNQEMIRYEHLFFRAIMPQSQLSLTRQTKPTQPWAENHFQERVGGEPLNPGEQYKKWPWYKNDEKFRNVDEKFTHTYMERYWPKNAGAFPKEDRALGLDHNFGIRYPFGDLNDVIKLLVKDPTTRQAYLPVWFPEDTGSVHGGRVPCTIGYHFQIIDDQLHCTYTIRAVDALRHFRNDVYLTVRLAQWVKGELLKNNDNRVFKDLQVGVLTMHVIDFHCFASEINLI